MEQRISLITLGVADLGHSRAFYEALGWQAGLAETDGIVFFQAGGMIFSLYPRENLARDAGVAADSLGRPCMALAYNTRSKEKVAVILNQARAAGATVLKEAEDTFWGGHAGSFADPDGFVWEVAWNPHFPIAPDGTIHLPSSPAPLTD